MMGTLKLLGCRCYHHQLLTSDAPIFSTEMIAGGALGRSSVVSVGMYNRDHTSDSARMVDGHYI